MKPLKVAYLIDSLGAGGSERSLAETLPHLVDAGIEPRVFVLSEPEHGFAHLLRDHGIEVSLIPESGWWARRVYLRRQLLSWRPDLLHTTLFDSDILGRLSAWGSGVPVVSSLVGVGYEPARFADPRIKRWRLKTVQWLDSVTGRHLNAHFHAVSQAAKDSAIRRLGLAPERVTVVRRGRDVDRFAAPDAGRRAAARRTWRVADDEILLVNVGRQTFHKAQIVLVEALDGLVRSGLPVRLVIAGHEGPSSAELAASVAAHGLDSHVRLPGHVEDVPGLLAAADIFVFPSRLEGFPGAVLEAMAMGLPIVAADIPATREILGKLQDVPLVAPESATELATTLERLATDQGRRERLGARNREIFLQRYDVRKTVPELLELYHQVAGNGASE